MIILAGATGALGGRIAHHLLSMGASVKALVRQGTDPSKVEALGNAGVLIAPVDFSRKASLVQACEGGDCVVSAVSGLEDVIITLQSQLLDAAIAAGVPRFIPSDFSIDYTRLPEGSNRNLDLRRLFNSRLDASQIAATSVLNGMFMDLLKGQAPVILYAIRRILYYGDRTQLMDFTTLEDTAAYTARVAVDRSSPRYLRIAGEVASSTDLQRIASETLHKRFRLLRPGGLGLLQAMIRFTRLVAPQRGEVFPAWQGMQYLHNMMSGLPKFTALDNGRYPDMRWTSIGEVILQAQDDPDR